MLNSGNRITYSNIITSIKNNVEIKKGMIVKRNVLSYKKSGDANYKYELNEDFWRDLDKTTPINVVIDEAHSIMNARRSMSKTNEIMNQWMALIRRIIGSKTSDDGELVLITQLWNRIDVIAREMAHQIRYHICHYEKTCSECRFTWSETSDDEEHSSRCYRCGAFDPVKHSHMIEVFKFSSMTEFIGWKDPYGFGQYYSHYYITDIENYFPLYDTHQWENLFEDIYN